MKKNIAIFASGGGSNAEVIIDHFKNSDTANITLIVTNKANAHVIERAKNHDIPFYIHSHDDIDNGNLVAKMKTFEIDFIVLAGYLKRIHPDLISNFPNKIVNIHPALLPKFGGKGMYGMNVHRAVIQAQEKTTGITIHYVNENYDEGNIIEQHACLIETGASPETVQKQVLELEHKYFAQSIAMLVSK
ncbi:MAG: phosphoribosylglycinamide formyltransferase [Crocinitomix sp.]|nr:phosphoribosylglycinamide formyltransferase [Crocinitomix sp.]